VNNVPPNDGREMHSRSRPGKQPDPDITGLRALRQATRDYIMVLDAAYAALTDDAIAGKPQLAYLRSALAVATGRRGGASFGTPIQMEHALSRLLGES
jgi:hypothetical protein